MFSTLMREILPGWHKKFKAAGRVPFVPGTSALDSGKNNESERLGEWLCFAFHSPIAAKRIVDSVACHETTLLHSCSSNLRFLKVGVARLMKSRYLSGLALLCGMNSLLLVGCVGLRNPLATPGSLQSINHIIVFAQENRSLDHYFGAMRQYWAQNGFADQSFDGLPQFNPASGLAPLQGPAPAVPGCDPTQPYPGFDACSPDTSNLISSFHFTSVCQEEQSPFWDESHVDWDYNAPTGTGPAALNGFVLTAADDARQQSPTLMDTNGIRAMGYFDGSDLNYYYFMASNFATSDRWFSPVMTNTPSNRAYLNAATTQGYVYPPGTDSQDKNLLTATTIFQELQAAGITWKIYVDPTNSKCSGPPYDPACLVTLSYIRNFQWGRTIPTLYPNNIAPVSQYFTDLQNGTLPQVGQFEPATDAGYDEHPSQYEWIPNDIQKGANYVSTLINGLMTSSSWKDSAFILTYDEMGGLYDHVAPQPTVSPDGIKPVDLEPGDICTSTTGPTCDFVYTGYRLPLIVVS